MLSVFERPETRGAREAGADGVRARDAGRREIGGGGGCAGPGTGRVVVRAPRKARARFRVRRSLTRVSPSLRIRAKCISLFYHYLMTNWL